MRTTTYSELEWLHDCTLLSVGFDSFDHVNNSLSLHITCPTDLGYNKWEGKTLVIIANDIACTNYNFWSAGGLESIDAVRSGVSALLYEKINKLKQIGIQFPSTELTFVFHSGSTLEIVCNGIQVSE